MSAIEETIRQIVIDELSKRQHTEELQSVSDFCKSKSISRVSIWRAEREGKVKLTRIGRKVFVNLSQFAI